MGAARIEIYPKFKARGEYGGIGSSSPIQVEVETTSTTATTAGSRHVVSGASAYAQLFARVSVDEACYLAVGADPTAAVSPGLSWLLATNVALEIPVKPGDKFSFKDVA